MSAFAKSALVILLASAAGWGVVTPLAPIMGVEITPLHKVVKSMTK